MRGFRAHQRRSGIWECKKTLPGGDRRSFYGSSESEATEKARRAFEALKRPDFDQRTVYGYYAQVFLPTIVHDSRSTQDLTATAFDNWWLPAIGDMDLKAVKRTDVQIVVNRMAAAKSRTGRPLSSGSVNAYAAKLARFFSLAVVDGLIPANPCDGVRLPTVRSESPDALKPWELRSLLESMDEPWLFNFVVLGGFFGLRAMEACGLMWSDFEDGAFTVVRQYPNEPLKTESACRTLPVPPKCEFRKTKGLYLVGEPYGSVWYAMSRLGFTAHSLRHTFNTILEWDLDCPRMVTRALMGHKGSTTDTYSHKDMEVMRGWLSKYWTHVEGFTTLQVSYETPKSRFV